MTWYHCVLPFMWVGRLLVRHRVIPNNRCSDRKGDSESSHSYTVFQGYYAMTPFAQVNKIVLIDTFPFVFPPKKKQMDKVAIIDKGS